MIKAQKFIERSYSQTTI